MIYIEARGVASCNLIIEAFTDKVPALRQQISSVLKKVGWASRRHVVHFSLHSTELWKNAKCEPSFIRGAIGSEGSSSYAFDQKGVLTVEMGGAMASLDEGMEHAIEVGAEDVQESEDDEGKPVLRVSFQLIISSQYSWHWLTQNQRDQEYILDYQAGVWIMICAIQAQRSWQEGKIQFDLKQTIQLWVTESRLYSDVFSSMEIPWPLLGLYCELFTKYIMHQRSLWNQVVIHNQFG